MDTNIQPQQEPPLLSWTAVIRQEHERGKKWYISAAVVLGLLLTYSIISNAWSFTLVIVLLTVAFVYTHHEPIPKKTIEIRSNGIQFDDDFTPIASCTGFWILKLSNYNELHIQRNEGKQKDIELSLGSTDKQKLRMVLSNLMPELTNKHEKIFDKIIRICKL